MEPSDERKARATALARAFGDILAFQMEVNEAVLAGRVPVGAQCDDFLLAIAIGTMVKTELDRPRDARRRFGSLYEEARGAPQSRGTAFGLAAAIVTKRQLSSNVIAEALACLPLPAWNRKHLQAPTTDLLAKMAGALAGEWASEAFDPTLAPNWEPTRWQSMGGRWQTFLHLLLEVLRDSWPEIAETAHLLLEDGAAELPACPDPRSDCSPPARP